MTHLVIAIGIAVAIMLPWMIFNAARFEAPILLTTNEGSVLLGANCDDTYYGSEPGGWELQCILDPAGTVRNEDTSQRSARQRREAIELRTSIT